MEALNILKQNVCHSTLNYEVTFSKTVFNKNYVRQNLKELTDGYYFG